MTIKKGSLSVKSVNFQLAFSPSLYAEMDQGNVVLKVQNHHKRICKPDENVSSRCMNDIDAPLFLSNVSDCFSKYV